MASVCFYFQVHQPFRLRRYSVFDEDPFYFDNEANRVILEKVANKCYRPATAKLLDLVRRHDGRFRLSFSLTGVLVEQMRQWTPDVIERFQELADTGCCEFLAETWHHSLAFLYSRDEFDEQVAAQVALMEELFGRTPTVFRNTELQYDDRVSDHVMRQGRFRGVIAEGVDRILGYRSPNYVYRAPCVPEDAGGPWLLLKKHTLSDDIAFRFGNQAWEEWPLTAERFAGWVDAINGDGYLCNLFMDYETLGEHQWADTGIFEFLDALPQAIFDVNAGANDFVTPSEALARHRPAGVYEVTSTTSWADTERDLSAWLGNGMQENAGYELYQLEGPVKERHAKGDEHILADWRRLTTSDHLYYMSTKFWADGDVHKYFSPYESPYDAYINFMNVLDNLRVRCGEVRRTVSV